jgi:saccharopepsin
MPNTRSSPASSHAVYDHTKSHSYEADGAGATGFRAFYAYVGFVSRDTVHVGSLSLANASFVEVTHVQDPPTFDTVAVDGVFGLSPDLERNVVLQRLAHSNALDEPVFAFYFAKQHGKKKTPTATRLSAATSVGELSIGAINRSRFKGEIHYVPTLTHKTWTVELDAITVSNDTTRGNFATTEMVAPVKRGGRTVVQAEVMPSWPLILGPAEDVKRLAKAVGVTGSAIDCSSHGPDIVVHIGGVPYTLTKDDYTLHDAEDDASSCSWAFVGLDFGHWWIGQPFLQKFYSVFEFGAGEDGIYAPRVGFALAT